MLIRNGVFRLNYNGWMNIVIKFHTYFPSMKAVIYHEKKFLVLTRRINSGYNFPRCIDK